MSQKEYLINNKELMKEWNYELNNNFGVFPNDITLGSHKKVYWKCKKCGYEWQAEVKCRTRKDGKATGCPICGRKKLSEYHATPIHGVNDFESNYPELAKEWNYEKNGELLPENITCGNKKIVWWKCPICGNEWENAISLRTKGFGKCKVCHKK